MAWIIRRGGAHPGRAVARSEGARRNGQGQPGIAPRWGTRRRTRSTSRTRQRHAEGAAETHLAEQRHHPRAGQR
eukprot:7312884-Pyramimonas_sp.AAC.1